jgi:hypothetical protein
VEFRDRRDLGRLGSPEEVPMRRRQRLAGLPRRRWAGGGRRTRTLAQRGNRAILYRAPGAAVALLVGLVAALAVAAAVAGYLLVGVTTMGVALLGWLGVGLRWRRLQPAGPGGDGPTPPGGVGVREPRRPLPYAPAGAAAMPLPEEPPERTARLG